MLTIIKQPDQFLFDCGLHIVQGLACIDNRKSLRFRLREGEVALSDTRVKLGFLNLQPIGRTPATGPVHTDLRWCIQQNRQVRLQVLLNPIGECIDGVLLESTSTALISATGVGKAIANYPLTALQSRLDRIVNMQ